MAQSLTLTSLLFLDVKKTFATLAAVAAMGLSLTACAADTPASSTSHTTTTSAAKTASTTPRASTTAAKSGTASASSTAAKSGSATAAKTAAPGQVPSGTMVKSVTKDTLPETVGNIKKKPLEGGASYDGTAPGEEFVVSLSKTADYDSRLKVLQGTEKPLGQLGVCGLRYGKADAPQCILKTESGMPIIIDGDFTSTPEQTKAFAIALATIIGTK